MEKNNFLIYNDIVYTLYQCKSYEALRDEFLPRLRLLIPFTYASIISVNPHNGDESHGGGRGDGGLHQPSYQADGNKG